MNQQPMNQRIQPPSAQNRTSPYGNMQSTPPHATGAHPQFAAAGQGQNANQSLQQPGSNPHVGGAVTTPQTPVFPPSQQGQTAQGNAQMATPLSPGSESREKERVTLLLEINRELLLAVIELQSTQQAEKKEGAAAAASSTPTEEKDKAEKEKAEKAKSSSGREYVEYVSVRALGLEYSANLWYDLDACDDFSQILHILRPLPIAPTSHRVKSLPIQLSCLLLLWRCI
jgi:hypothetical protein